MARRTMMEIGTQMIGSAFGQRTALQLQSPPGPAQRRDRRIQCRARHAQPDIPSAWRPLASRSEASAAGPFAGPMSHESPLIRQPFTGVLSVVTLAL